MIKRMIRSVFKSLGYEIIRSNKNLIPPDMDSAFHEIYNQCREYTMTNVDKMYSLYRAVEYVSRCKIPGDIVECGVWKGGSCMLVALTLMKMGERNRKIYLYDTFEGMSEPMEKDQMIHDGRMAVDIFKETESESYHRVKCFSPLDEVTKNIFSTGYPPDNLVFVKGKVEETLPATTPQTISILRLDTDWYESTYHEVVHLYPKLSKKGVLILDDYGFWKGAREAADRYFDQNKTDILLNRIDPEGCYLGIKAD
ncbi:MAG: TylF/MycF family methyltransferase [Nitrososphaera sp.]|nr:TylF/MycF family methyltransferase [Nitrososphaera sp.]